MGAMPDRRRAARGWRVSALLALALWCAAGGATPPRDFVVETRQIELDGEVHAVDVYRPTADAPVRAAIVAHGFNRSPKRHRDLAEALAAAGITTIVPELSSVVNLWGNTDTLVELAHRLESGALGLPPLDRASVVLIGTSAGGLESVVAATRLPGIAGWIGLDPVDGTGAGAEAAAALTAPAVVLLGPHSRCNLFGTGRTIARAIHDLRHTEVFHGASHCDFEGPTNRFCEAVCGRASGEQQERIRLETVNAARELLDDAVRPGR